MNTSIGSTCANRQNRLFEQQRKRFLNVPLHRKLTRLSCESREGRTVVPECQGIRAQRLIRGHRTRRLRRGRTSTRYARHRGYIRGARRASVRRSTRRVHRTWDFRRNRGRRRILSRATTHEARLFRTSAKAPVPTRATWHPREPAAPRGIGAHRPAYTEATRHRFPGTASEAP